jgi:hypothetical protein
VYNLLVELVLVPMALAQAAPANIPVPAACDFRFGGAALAPGAMFACIPAYISVLTEVVIGFCASICLIRLIIAGFRYMSGSLISGSSDDARKDIFNALLGLAVSLLTYIIIETVVFYVTRT